MKKVPASSQAHLSSGRDRLGLHFVALCIGSFDLTVTRIPDRNSLKDDGLILTQCFRAFPSIVAAAILLVAVELFTSQSTDNQAGIKNNTHPRTASGDPHLLKVPLPPENRATNWGLRVQTTNLWGHSTFNSWHCPLIQILTWKDLALQCPGYQNRGVWMPFKS